MQYFTKCTWLIKCNPQKQSSMVDLLYLPYIPLFRGHFPANSQKFSGKLFFVSSETILNNFLIHFKMLRYFAVNVTGSKFRLVHYKRRQYATKNIPRVIWNYKHSFWIRFFRTISTFSKQLVEFSSFFAFSAIIWVNKAT